MAGEAVLDQVPHSWSAEGRLPAVQFAPAARPHLDQVDFLSDLPEEIIYTETKDDIHLNKTLR